MLRGSVKAWQRAVQPGLARAIGRLAQDDIKKLAAYTLAGLIIVWIFMSVVVPVCYNGFMAIVNAFATINAMVSDPVPSALDRREPGVSARYNKEAVAFIWCDRIGERNATEWLEAEREYNEEDRRLPPRMREYTARMCIRTRPWSPPQDFSDGGHYERIAARTAQLARQYTARQFVATFAPRAEHALIDYYGDVFVRVVGVFSPTDHDFSPRIVRLRDLQELLTAMREHHRRLIGSGQEIVPGACVCPVHLGIVMSDLYFTRNADFLPTPPQAVAEMRAKSRGLVEDMRRRHVYRVLLGADVRAAKGAATYKDTIRMPVHLFPFPARADAVLVAPNASVRELDIPRKLTAVACDPLPLYLEQVVTRIVPAYVYGHGPHPLDRLNDPGGFTVDDEPPTDEFQLQSPRAYLLNVSLAEASGICATGTEIDLNGPRDYRPYCLLHCQTLEHALFRPGSERRTRQHSQLPAATAAAAKADDDDDDDDGGGGGGDDDDLSDKKLEALLHDLVRKREQRQRRRRRGGGGGGGGGA